MKKSLTISQIGEKRLISEFIRPYFNSENKIEGVGDDCGMLHHNGDIWLFSTDRVPADLISFRLGILDYFGLGRYLACLNISDIAACGGQPLALLLNMGLPGELEYSAFQDICKGFRTLAIKYDCQVLGGDITSCSELSISATSIGKIKKDFVLTRRGAQKGDTIFFSKPLGLTPAAFGFFLGLKGNLECSEDQINLLRKQFTHTEPMISLGNILSSSGACSSCMDNTDGIGQSLLELSEASQTSMVIKKELVTIPPIVEKISVALGEETLNLACSGGADFGLIGTLKGFWNKDEIKNRFGDSIFPIGYVDTGDGVYVENDNKRNRLVFSGWNYFSQNITKNTYGDIKSM